jgi:hypothetical protein
MHRLIDIGFRPVGPWTAENGGIRPALTDLSDAENVLYAFVSNGEVLYVGKTTQTLKARMYGYQNPGPTQSTKINGNRLIAEMLKSGNPVQILVLPDNGLLHFGIFHLNLAAGLEDSIVATVKPKWNQTGK